MTQTIEQLKAKVAELEKDLLKTKLDLLTSYGESEELLGRIAELEAENAKLHEQVDLQVPKMAFTQLKEQLSTAIIKATKPLEEEEEVERLKIDVEFWKGYSKAKLDDLLQQLAAEQLNNKLLREALEAVIKVHGYESGIPVEALSTPASTEALDAYVIEKLKETKGE